MIALLEDDKLCEIADLVMAGYSTAEIAKQTNRTQRTVQRRLRMIQDIWNKANPGVTDDTEEETRRKRCA